MKRNHEVEKLYMEQIRNIETAVHMISNERENLMNYKNSLKIPTRVPSLHYVEPFKPDFGLFTLLGSTIGAIIFLVVVFKLFGTVGEWLSSKFIGRTCPRIIAFAVIIGLIAFLFIVVKHWKEYNEDMKKYKNEVKKHENEIIRIKKFDEERFKDTYKYERAIEKAEAELKKAKDIRNKLYAINWIPVQYRNIRVAYYICDMVTTSSISIDEALKYFLLQETNNKLDAVLNRLDDIIYNQKTIIMNQAITKSQNQRIINNNKAMISKIASIENNARLASEYSQVSARYSEASAYFSLATYLKR